MSHITTHMLTVVLLCFGFEALAQAGFDAHILYLKSGKKPLNEEWMITLKPDEVSTGHFYRFVQFYEFPDQNQRQLLKNAGIELLDFIPSNTFITSFPLYCNFDILENLNIRAIAEISPENKLAPDLNRTSAKQDHFILQFQKNISTEEALCFLENKHLEILDAPFSNNAFRIESSFDIIERLVTAPEILYIDEDRKNSRPEDSQGLALHRANVLNTIFHSDRKYDGTGVSIAIGDDGFVGPHIDFKGRISNNHVSLTAQNEHGDMVAGILGGAGNLDPKAEGIVKGARLHILEDFDAVEQASLLYETNQVVITSTSYGDGCNRGYTTFTQLADQQITDCPSLIHVFSAGNSGDQDCFYGAGPGWGNITGGVKVGKNVLAVGNVDQNDQLVYNSSRGPSNDGRIKPDLCANGEGQQSTASNNNYQNSSGSSAAAPVVSGVLAQLYQAHRSLNNDANPESALLKAILLNSAEDLGLPGPDYSYGWGRVDASRAIEALENNYYLADSLSHNQEQSYTINIPQGAQQVKVMIYWNDPAGSTVSSKSLVNDLDLEVFYNNELHFPWHPQPSTDPVVLAQGAISSPDHINNVEQVVLNNLNSDNFTINVKGYSIPLGSQKYYIVYQYSFDDLKINYPLGGESFNPGEAIRIFWNAGISTGNFDLEYSTDGGESWSNIATVAGHLRFYDWNLPDNITGQALIRISKNGLSSQQTKPFNIYNTPTGFTVTQICPDHISLEWEPSSEAASYTIYQLGDHYMDSVAITSATSIDLSINNPEQGYWFAIQAHHQNGAISPRSRAIMSGNALFECSLEHDLRLVSIAQPNTHLIQSCFEQDIQLAINLKNEGTTFQSGFKLYYQIDEQVPVAVVYPGSIPPGVTVNYAFEPMLAFSQEGEYSLKIWSSSETEQARYNDTLHTSLTLVNSALVEIPYFQNFDNFSICNYLEKCRSTCELQAGWRNGQNELEDAIDWQTNRGSTPSQHTGPSGDQNSNNEFGNYLYLEGSPGCYQDEAILYSPCIDLSNSIEPLLSFWYHMSGSDMGNLHLDLFDGNTWYNNIMIPLVGNQGTEWQKAEVDLSTFNENIINLRFRAYTGNGARTDLAIDNFSIVETAAPPIADFIPENYLICTNQTVQLFDNSYNEPTEWHWSISPTTFSFVDGSSAHSPNPFVTFANNGVYSITLQTTNAYGTDEIVKYDFIAVTNGQGLPYMEDFNDTPIPSLNWKIENPDFSTTWQDISILGTDGQATHAVYVNNHGYNAVGEKDALISKIIDLTEAENPLLRFDYSYAPFNQNFNDVLRVELSADCKESFSEVLFEKAGNDLATAPAQMRGWTPNSSVDWKTEIIDLSEYMGNRIALKFVNICDFGNNLYLDNIAVYEQDDFPKAAFDISPNATSWCVGENIYLENLSTGLNLHPAEWTIVNADAQDTIIGSSDQTLSFQHAGQYTISLKVSNDLGWDKVSRAIDIVDEPIVNFSYLIEGNTVSFFNESVFGESYFWDFGDGFTSTAEHPTHSFTQTDTYQVTLVVNNHCGEQSSVQTFVITNTSDLEKQLKYQLSPNPADDLIFLEFSGDNINEFEFYLTDINGRTVYQQKNNYQNSAFHQSIDISHLPAGLFFFTLRIGEKTSTQKIVIL